jgi:hypothetical protein
MADETQCFDSDIPFESQTSHLETSDQQCGLVRSDSPLSLSDLPPGFSSRDLLLADEESSDDDYSADENSQGAGGMNTSNHKPRSIDTADDVESDDEKEFVASEYRVIATHLRVIVVALFVGLFVTVPVAVYQISRNNEEESFEATFLGISSKVIDNVEFQLARKLNAMDSLRIALTSQGSNMPNNQTWPFVTVPDWDLRGNNVRDAGALLSIALHPKVTQDNREEWKDYVQENLGWLWQAQDRRVQTLPFVPNQLRGKRVLQEELRDDDLHVTLHRGQVIMEEIFRLDNNSAIGVVRENNTNAPFFPTWMHMPPVSEFINFNFLSTAVTSEASRHTITAGEATISRAADPGDDGSDSRKAFESYITSLLQEHSRDETVTYEGDPIATLSYPVFDGFDVESPAVVAILTSLIHFQQFFSVVFPGDGGSILGVLSNTCGDTFSYEINRESAIFLGSGDHHDASFDSQKQFYNFSELASSSHYPRFEESIKLSEQYCAYSLKIYPTRELYQQYVTNDPVKYAVTMFLVIAFISCVFLAYDRVVQRRMQTILRNAKNSRAIVTSLFPAKVRNRLLKEELARKERLTTEPRRNSLNSIGSQTSSRRNSAQHSRRMSNETPTKRMNNDLCNSSRRSSNEGRRNSNEARSTPVGRRRNSGDLITDIFPFSTAVHGVSNVVTGVGTIAGNLLLAPSKLRLKFFLREDNPNNGFESYGATMSGEDSENEKPIADLFPHCTVLFADISGFTGMYQRRTC